MKRPLCALSFLAGLTLALTGCAPSSPIPGTLGTSTGTMPQGTQHPLPGNTMPGGPGPSNPGLPGATQPGLPMPGSSMPGNTMPGIPSTPNPGNPGNTMTGTTPLPNPGTGSTMPGGTGPLPMPGAVPAPYAGQVNPNPADDSGAIISGGLRYKKNCSCHVDGSRLENPLAPKLALPPMAQMPDDWLLWKMSEGKGPEMPPFKDTFSMDERWQIITYLRALAVKKAQGSGNP